MGTEKSFNLIANCKVKINSIFYTAHTQGRQLICEGCVAEFDDKLCEQLPNCIDIIWIKGE